MKKLTIFKDAEILAYQHHAFGLGIILQHKDGYTWLYNHYIQLYFSRNAAESNNQIFNFYMDFILHQSIFEREYLSNEMLEVCNKDSIDFIQKAIEKNRYVIAVVDEYYIPNREQFQKEHFLHDVCILGYDEKLKEFNIVGYDQNFEYRESSVSYAHLKLSKPSFIQLISLKEGFTEKLNLSSIALQLEQYINKANNILIEDLYQEDNIYGIAACRELISMYKDNIKECRNCDLRAMLLFAEHKKVMYERINEIARTFQMDLADIQQQYYDVQQKAKELFHVMIKYNLQKDTSIYCEFEKEGVDLLNKEEWCLEELCKKISHYIVQ